MTFLSLLKVSYHTGLWENFPHPIFSENIFLEPTPSPFRRTGSESSITQNRLHPPCPPEKKKKKKDAGEGKDNE